MKKQNKFLLALASTFILNSLPTLCQIKIPAAFFGVNLWNTNFSGAPFSTITSFDAPKWNAIMQTGAKTIRVGGIAYCVNKGNGISYPNKVNDGVVVPNPAGYVKIVDDCRANGYEPMLTVPFDGRDVTRLIEEQAEAAADIVRTVNKIHNRNVSIRPNPTSNEAFLSYQSMSGRNAEFVISTIQGSEVHKQKVEPNKSEIRIDCSALPGGVYFVTLWNEGRKIGTKKLVIAR